MEYYDCLLTDFLENQNLTKSFVNELRKIGENPEWYFKKLGNHESVIELAFEWSETELGELHWMIVNEQYKFFIEGNKQINSKTIHFKGYYFSKVFIGCQQ